MLKVNQTNVRKTLFSTLRIKSDKTSKHEVLLNELLFVSGIKQEASTIALFFKSLKHFCVQLFKKRD